MDTGDHLKPVRIFYHAKTILEIVQIMKKALIIVQKDMWVRYVKVVILKEKFGTQLIQNQTDTRVLNVKIYLYKLAFSFQYTWELFFKSYFKLTLTKILRIN